MPAAGCSCCGAKARIVMEKFSTFVSTLGGLDKALRVLQYSLALVATSSSVSSNVVKRTNNALRPISEARVTMRLFGTIPLLTKLWRDSCIEKATGKADSRCYNIERAKDLSLLLYQVCELRWWLAEHGVVPSVNKDTWSQLSCAGWAAWIILELNPVFASLFWVDSKDTLFQNMRKILKTNPKTALYYLSLLFDLPLAINWSLPFSRGLPGLNARRTSLLGLLGGTALVTLTWP